MATALVLNPSILDAPPLSLPSDYVTLPDGYTPKPHRFVGLLACQMNPLLRSLDTKITRVGKKVTDEASKPKNPKSSKKSKMKAEQEEKEELIEWEIECEDTVIFPEGGGQPCDHGILELKSSPSHQRLKVVSAFRRNLDAVHVFRVAPSFDPVVEGWIPGAEVHMEVDWDRRTYHMQQHTGQHLISAIFEHKLKNDTVGWMLSSTSSPSPPPTPSYLDLSSPPSPSTLAFVQSTCNALIQTSQTRLRVSVKLDSASERPNTLPSSYRDGVIRTIHIDNLDANPCCGTHHPHLSFLGSVLIYPTIEKISGPTRYRIYFAVGNAILSHMLNSHSILKSLGSLLDCGPPDLVDRLGTLQKSKKDLTRRERALKLEAARALVGDLEGSVREVGNSSVLVGELHREEESTDVEFLSSIISLFQERMDKKTSSPDSSPPPPPTPWLVILSSGPFPGSSTTPNAGGCVVIGGSSEKLVMKAGELVKAKFGGRVKGGGKWRWQGKVVNGGWEKGDKNLFGEVVGEAAKTFSSSV